MFCDSNSIWEFNMHYFNQVQAAKMLFRHSSKPFLGITSVYHIAMQFQLADSEFSFFLEGFLDTISIALRTFCRSCNRLYRHPSHTTMLTPMKPPAAQFVHFRIPAPIASCNKESAVPDSIPYMKDSRAQGNLCTPVRSFNFIDF